MSDNKFFEELADVSKSVLEQQKESKTIDIKLRVIYAMAALDGFCKPLEAVDVGLFLNELYNSKIWINVASRDLKEHFYGEGYCERCDTLAFASGSWYLSEKGVRYLAEQFNLEVPENLKEYREKHEFPTLKPSHLV